jgi:hypothetical protein
MHSSISSSSLTVLDRPHSQLSVLESAPVVSAPPPNEFERPIPALPWLKILLVVASTTLVLMVGWEIGMRHLGLRAGDLDDGHAQWAEERRKVDSGPRDSVVIIGDSRILLDTDLDTWQRLTGRRPIQLALLGTNAQPILHDIAFDNHFAGLLVIGTSEFSYYTGDGNTKPAVLNYYKTESPSQRLGQKLYKELSRYFAFLDHHYTLTKLIENHHWPERKGVDGPYLDNWKVSETYEGRQEYLWDRLERDDYLRMQARTIWTYFFSGPPVKPDKVERVSVSTKADIDRIRARGGEIVWVRPPSTGPLLEIERTRYPRAKVWDKLVHDTGAFGEYFEDYPEMQHLSMPDWSHLTKPSAIAFTDAYVRVLRDCVGWFSARGITAGGSCPNINHQQISQR